MVGISLIKSKLCQSWGRALRKRNWKIVRWNRPSSKILRCTRIPWQMRYVPTPSFHHIACRLYTLVASTLIFSFGIPYPRFLCFSDDSVSDAKRSPGKKNLALVNSKSKREPSFIIVQVTSNIVVKTLVCPLLYHIRSLFRSLRVILH